MSIPVEQVKCIAHRTIREADTDGDKLISFDEFKEVNLNSASDLSLPSIPAIGSEKH